MNAEETRRIVDRAWEGGILQTLHEYITIPNQSPAFDPRWRAHGYMEQAVELIASWLRQQPIEGMEVEVVHLEERTPLILAEVAGDGAGTVLLYGHLDKQPPLQGWRSGRGPWLPVLEEDRLYGRGAADDGYAAFAAATAIQAVQRLGLPHARCVLLIEACEESGSLDLPHYMRHLRQRIGEPSLVIGLDSGCGDYDRLWVTTSLRGLVSGNLRVSTLTEGVHSGKASGIVPSSFRVLRLLLERLEDAETGMIRPRQLQVPVPEERWEQIRSAAAVLADTMHRDFPFRPGTRPAANNVEELLLNQTWRAQLEITGAGGLPGLEEAGNVLRASTAAKVSLRIPPTANGRAANALVKEIFETDPPYGAEVRFEAEQAATGWNAPPLAPWLADSLQEASSAFFGRAACYLGEGGTIPFMSMLGEQYPAAQFLITGVLGPHSNAHGPNEFLHVPTAKRLTACVARVLADHRRATAGG
jgi:acetylornithine deacetylase/succinyl-diaminopimelate desuccinylase-like protein